MSNSSPGRYFDVYIIKCIRMVIYKKFYYYHEIKYLWFLLKKMILFEYVPMLGIFFFLTMDDQPIMINIKIVTGNRFCERIRSIIVYKK